MPVFSHVFTIHEFGSTFCILPFPFPCCVWSPYFDIPPPDISLRSGWFATRSEVSIWFFFPSPRTSTATGARAHVTRGSLEALGRELKRLPHATCETARAIVKLGCMDMSPLVLLAKGCLLLLWGAIIYKYLYNYMLPLPRPTFL